MLAPEGKAPFSSKLRARRALNSPATSIVAHSVPRFAQRCVLRFYVTSDAMKLASCLSARGTQDDPEENPR
eukprot:7791981-Pyramimonas_sp.AAC.1